MSRHIIFNSKCAIDSFYFKKCEYLITDTIYFPKLVTHTHQYSHNRSFQTVEAKNLDIFK